MSTSRKEESEARKFEVSRKAAERLLQKHGLRLARLDEIIEDTPDDTHYITELRFKLGIHTGGAVMTVIKSDGPNGKQVAFQVGETIGDAITGLVNRMDNGTLAWREDKPYETAKN